MYVYVCVCMYIWTCTCVYGRVCVRVRVRMRIPSDTSCDHFSHFRRKSEGLKLKWTCEMTDTLTLQYIGKVRNKKNKVFLELDRVKKFLFDYRK